MGKEGSKDLIKYSNIGNQERDVCKEIILCSSGGVRRVCCYHIISLTTSHIQGAFLLQIRRLFPIPLLATSNKSSHSGNDKNTNKGREGKTINFLKRSSAMLSLC